MKTILKVLVVSLIIIIFSKAYSIYSYSEKIERFYPSVQKEKQIFAHYMTWFGRPEISNGWCNWAWFQKGHRRNPDRILPNGRRDIASLHYPLIGPYDSTDEDVVEYHILLAKAAGIDGFVVNWYGFEDENGNPRHEDIGFKKLLKAAEKLNFKVCIDIDDKCMFPPFSGASNRHEAVIEASEDVKRIFSEYGKSKAYFRINGRPVITNFGWGPPFMVGKNATSFSPEEWREIFGSAGDSQPLFIANYQWHWNRSIEETGFLDVADSIYPWVSGGPDRRIKFYEESKQALAEGKIKFISGEACPGFDSYGTWGWGGGRTILPRKEGEVYKMTWDECLKYDAHWIQIITWNDFAEGSTIEPTFEYGYKYLEITSDYTSKLKNKNFKYSAIRIPKEIYDIKSQIKKLRKNGKTGHGLLGSYETETEKAIDLFVEGDYNKTQSIVNKLKEEIEQQEIKFPEDKEVELSIYPKETTIFAGTSKDFSVVIRNKSKEPVKGKLSIVSEDGIPSNWLIGETVRIDLNAGEETMIPFQISVPKKRTKTIKAMIEAKLKSGKKLVRSPVAVIEVKPFFFHMDIGPNNILRLNKKEKVSVRITNQGDASDSGNIVLEVPHGWKVNPSKASYVLNSTDEKKIDFFVTPTSAVENAVVTALLTSHSKEKLSVSEPFKVIEETEVAVVKGDINADGRTDFVLGNNEIEVQVTSALGGRILAFYLRETQNNQLFLEYPAVEKVIDKDSQEWVEYGGINDTFPDIWPGEVWNNEWQYKIEESAEKKSLIMSAVTKDNLLLKRKMTLTAETRKLHVSYTVENLGKEDASFVWSTHPDLAPGPPEKAELIHKIIVPTIEGIVNEPFKAIMDKKHYFPSEGWCLALDSKSEEYFAQQFDKDSVWKIGYWQGKDFFTVELIFKEFILKPKESRNFNISYLAGKSDWEKAVRQ
ncbi:MAG: hypothetical protein JW983_09090 [Elusimicrobia bacterium]|nr:hypothetical protein [Elusimicrobiota bacterium]